MAAKTIDLRKLPNLAHNRRNGRSIRRRGSRQRRYTTRAALVTLRLPVFFGPTHTVRPSRMTVATTRISATSFPSWSREKKEREKMSCGDFGNEGFPRLLSRLWKTSRGRLSRWHEHRCGRRDESSNFRLVHTVGFSSASARFQLRLIKTTCVELLLWRHLRRPNGEVLCCTTRRSATQSTQMWGFSSPWTAADSRSRRSRSVCVSVT